MSKMASSEAYRIFHECEDLLTRLRQENTLISETIDSPDASRRPQFHQENYDEFLTPRIADCLEKAGRASQQAGWWNKKIARTYITQIAHERTHIEWGINLLSKRLEGGVPASGGIAADGDTVLDQKQEKLHRDLGRQMTELADLSPHEQARAASSHYQAPHAVEDVGENHVKRLDQSRQARRGYEADFGWKNRILTDVEKNELSRTILLSSMLSIVEIEKFANSRMLDSARCCAVWGGAIEGDIRRLPLPVPDQRDLLDFVCLIAAATLIKLDQVSSEGELEESMEFFASSYTDQSLHEARVAGLGMTEDDSIVQSYLAGGASTRPRVGTQSDTVWGEKQKNELRHDLEQLLTEGDDELESERRAVLDQIDHEDFGYCIACAQPIGLMRLRILPTSTRCVDCQARYDSNLGKRES